MKPWNSLTDQEQKKFWRDQLRLIVQKAMEQSGKEGMEFIESIRKQKEAYQILKSACRNLILKGELPALLCAPSQKGWIRFVLGPLGTNITVDLSFQNVEELLFFLE